MGGYPSVICLIKSRPSIVMRVYAAATEVSASRMFMAGFVPGLMMEGFLMLAIYVIARVKGLPAQKSPGFPRLLRSGAIASPTAAASVAAIYAFLIAVVGYRDTGPLKGIAWRKADEKVGKATVRNLLQVSLALPQSFYNEEVRKAMLDAAVYYRQCHAVCPCAHHRALFLLPSPR
jgi:C4-dicarboxylate transporter DctM subunit